jgi:hypothetical protein
MARDAKKPAEDTRKKRARHAAPPDLASSSARVTTRGMAGTGRMAAAKLRQHADGEEVVVDGSSASVDGPPPELHRRADVVAKVRNCSLFCFFSIAFMALIISATSNKRTSARI